MGFLEAEVIKDQTGTAPSTALALEEEKNPVDNINMLDPVVGFIKERYFRSRQRRQADEQRWLESYRNYRGLYGPDVQFSEEEKSRFFIKVTKTKVLAAYAQIIDVLFAGGKFPIGVEPTPVSKGDVPDQVSLDPKAPPGGGDTGMPPTIARKELGPLTKMLNKVKDLLVEGPNSSPTAAVWEPVKEAAKKMERQIHDQLEES